MSQQQSSLQPSNERQIQLAIQDLKEDANLSVRRAAAVCKVAEATLRDRRAGRPSQANRWPATMNLTKLEEDVVAKHIIDLIDRGFPPRLAEVADMANSLRAERNLGQVGLNWPSTFVKRRPELKMKFNRKYDYKRALCESPDDIRTWFELVRNTKAKHGILDDDTWNFDETGFMMGQITPGMVVTASERRARPKAI
jgi:hypothetical protein